MSDRDLILMAIQTLVSGINILPSTERELKTLEVLTLINEDFMAQSSTG